MVYKWKNPGYGVVDFNVEANVVGECLAEIEAMYGSISVDNFLEYSRPEDSKTHSLLEWEDSVAAELWRKKQAHVIITNIVIVEETPITKEVETEIEADIIEATFNEYPAFLNINPKRIDSGIFVNSNVALSNEETRNIVLRRALNELRMFKNKYNTLKELAEVFQAIDDVLKKESED